MKSAWMFFLILLLTLSSLPSYAEDLPNFENILYTNDFISDWKVYTCFDGCNHYSGYENNGDIDGFTVEQDYTEFDLGPSAGINGAKFMGYFRVEDGTIANIRIKVKVDVSSLNAGRAVDIDFGGHYCVEDQCWRDFPAQTITADSQDEWMTLTLENYEADKRTAFEGMLLELRVFLRNPEIEPGHHDPTYPDDVGGTHSTRVQVKLLSSDIDLGQIRFQKTCGRCFNNDDQCGDGNKCFGDPSNSYGYAVGGCAPSESYYYSECKSGSSTSSGCFVRASDGGVRVNR